MDDLLKTLLEPLVTDIKKVKIDKVQNNNYINYKVSIPQKDIAKVIGKNGKMIKSIKNLMKIKSVKENVYTSIELIEV